MKEVDKHKHASLLRGIKCGNTGPSTWGPTQQSEHFLEGFFPFLEDRISAPPRSGSGSGFGLDPALKL